jgi:flagellar basal-body rod modification protein FlgD
VSIPATEPVSTGMYQPATPATGAAGGADKEMFLQLLVAQLRYQDPMNPADSGQFLSQSAQFTALEKMQDVADQTSALLAAQVSFGASGLVGKQITYLDKDGTSVPGTVSSVTYDATGPTLVVDGTSVLLSQVQSVDAGSTTSTTTGSSTGASTTTSTTTTTP